MASLIRIPMPDQRIIDLRNRKIESQMTYEEIAQKSGLSLSSVQKVLGGATASPRPETLDPQLKSAGSIYSFLSTLTHI